MAVSERLSSERVPRSVWRAAATSAQVRAGVHAIDLVIEGEDDRRLAIECDGDRHQATDLWVADMARQRVLERAGWTFWRCFASSFTLQRDAVVNDLIAFLEAMKIRPIGEAQSSRAIYTEHREIAASVVPAPMVDPVPSRAARARAAP